MVCLFCLSLSFLALLIVCPYFYIIIKDLNIVGINLHKVFFPKRMNNMKLKNTYRSIFQGGSFLGCNRFRKCLSHFVQK